MSAPTSTVTSLVSIGNREDLEDVIYRVAPEATPFIKNIGTAKATNVFHEWQTETLAAASASNASVEGNTFAIAAGNFTTRVGNYCQIFTKAFGVSRTEEVAKKAGRTSEINRQKVLKMIECRRDLEAASIGNFTSVVESGATARRIGGALAWLSSNTSLGASGANHGFSAGIVTKADDGTQRVPTEAMLKTVMASIFNSRGGQDTPLQAYMGATQKQEVSAFTGIATIRHDAPGAKRASIVGAADVYVSDFGNIDMIPHAYALTRDILIIDPDMWALATFDGWKSTELAQTSDSTQYAITYEGTLVCRNEKASGAIRDCN